MRTISLYQKTAYHNQRHCQSVNSKGIACKGIAVTGSNYCFRHCGISKVQRLTNKQNIKAESAINKTLKAQVNSVPINCVPDGINSAPGPVQRYAPNNPNVDGYYRDYLSRPDLLDMRNEVALLQSMLQTIINAPGTRLELQLAVMDRLEKFITAIAKIEQTDKALNAAQDKVRLVINQCAIVINECVKDRDVKRVISRRLMQLATEATAASAINTDSQRTRPGPGQECEQEQGTGTGTDQEPVAASQCDSQPVAVDGAAVPAGGAETGEAGVGLNVEHPIGSLPAPADFLNSDSENFENNISQEPEENSSGNPGTLPLQET